MDTLTETMVDADMQKTTFLAFAGGLLQLLTYDAVAKTLSLVGLILYVVYLGYSIWCKRIELKQRRALTAASVGALLSTAVGGDGDEDDVDNPNTDLV